MRKEPKTAKDIKDLCINCGDLHSDSCCGAPMKRLTAYTLEQAYKMLNGTKNRVPQAA